MFASKTVLLKGSTSSAILASITKFWPLIFVTGPWVERVGWVEHDGVVCFIFGKACPVVVRNILVVINLVLFDSPVMDLIVIPLGAARMPTFLLVAMPAKTTRASTRAGNNTRTPFYDASRST